MSRKGWLAPFVYFSSNWISLLGVILTTTGALLWLILLPSMLRGSAKDPYLGILQFMLLPGIFFAGLALIPLGIWHYKKRNQGALPEVFPPLDLANSRFRKLLVFLAATTSGQRRHRSPVHIPRRALHGVCQFLRADLPCRHEARIHCLSELTPLARALRRVPYRSGRQLVRQEQNLRQLAGDQRDG